MKKILMIAAVLLFSLNSFSQNVKMDKEGNFHAVVKDSTTTGAKETGKFYFDSKKNKYPVMVSAKGKYFIVRTSAKGNKYNFYLQTTAKND